MFLLLHILLLAVGQPLGGEAGKPHGVNSMTMTRTDSRSQSLPLSVAHKNTVPDAVLLNQSVVHRLKAQLMQYYDSTVRPIRNETRATKLYMSMGVLAILSVDETESKLRAFVSSELHWQDEYLVWSPDDYDGLQLLTIPLHLLWQPDLMCDQTVDVKRPLRPDRELVRVDHTGMVTFLVLEIHEFACPMESEHFPFDNQTCHLTYGSYGYDSSQVRWGAPAQLHFTPEAHPEWSITNFSAEHDLAEFSQLQLTLAIRRKPAFYVITLMYPSSLITLLSILGMFTPSEANLTRTEKINVAMSTLLTLSVLLIVVADIIPKSQSGYPQIGVFFFAQIGSIVCHTLVAILIMYVNSLAEWNVRMPRCLRWLLPREKRGQTSPSVKGVNSCAQRYRCSSSGSDNELHNNKDNNGKAGALTRSVYQMELESTLRALIHQVEECRRQLQVDTSSDWNRLCFVLDFVALCVFLAFQAWLTFAYCTHDGQIHFG